MVGVAVDDADGDPASFGPKSVILAAGGFEANAECASEHLGEGWSRAKVRGTPLQHRRHAAAALEVGAAPYGDWSTCHSVAWDAGASDEGRIVS